MCFKLMYVYIFNSENYYSGKKEFGKMIIGKTTFGKMIIQENEIG